MVVLFVGDSIEAMAIKNLLKSLSIEAFMVNEYVSSIRPDFFGGFNSVSLQVDEADFEKAKTIFEDYNKGDFSLNS